MKKNTLRFSRSFLLLSFFLLGSFILPARAENSLLKIQVLPDQNSVKVGMMFLVSVRVANSSSDSSTDFWANNCSYEKHWVTDDPEVFIQPWTCEENTLEQIPLDPSGIYEKSIILYIPKRDKAGLVTFRLGFKPMSENGDVGEPLWSDPVAINVIVPEDMTDAAPAAGPADQAEKKASANSAIMNDVSQDAMPALAAPAVSQAMVFQDPGVPIKIRPGEEFSIALVSNPSTGFRWKMTLPGADKTVTFLGSKHVASQDVMPGVPGTEVFKFKAITPGETKADFVYERPWEPIVAPTRKIFTILVQEN